MKNRGTKRANPPGWEQGNTFSRDKEEQAPEKQEEVELVPASSTYGVGIQEASRQSAGIWERGQSRCEVIII